MVMDESLRKKLESGRLTDDDVLAILDWQLSLPAEEIDCGLIAECDLFLDPDATGLDKTREDAIFAGLLEKIRASEAVPAKTGKTARPAPKRTRAHHHARPSRVLLIALITILLLALAVGSVAYSVHRGVLNFTEDFGFAEMVSQEGAEEFVTSGTLAHLSLEHVDVDVLEAVYDGVELRVVYGLTDLSGEIHLSEYSDSYEMPGTQEGDVHMCDSILINGQDAYFYDTWEMPGEKPGQMLYYLQTNLSAWGVDVSGAEELVIGLPMLPRSEETGRFGVVEFTIPAAVPEGLVRTATLKEDTMGGHPVRVVKSVFSPLNGYIEIFIEGLTREFYSAAMTGWGEIYAMDGSILTSMHPEGPVKDDAQDGMTLGFTITPTEGSWPDEMILALEFNDYSPDWEVTLQLSDSAN